jgi:hypothetical protein
LDFPDSTSADFGFGCVTVTVDAVSSPVPQPAAITTTMIAPTAVTDFLGHLIATPPQIECLSVNRYHS